MSLLIAERTIMRIAKTLVAFLAMLTYGTLTAQAEAEILLNGKLGKPTVADSFDSPKLSAKWAAAKGEFKVVDGAIVGKELKADKHAAVLTYKVPNQNSAIQFSFQLNGAKALHLSLNKQRGHLYRVLITKNNIAIKLDKDKKDPKSKAKVLVSQKTSFENGEWYTVLVTNDGENASVMTSNGVNITGSHASLNQKKPSYRFIVAGESVHLDDVKIWKLK